MEQVFIQKCNLTYPDFLAVICNGVKDIINTNKKFILDLKMKLVAKIVLLKSGEAFSTESELSAEYVDVLLLSYDSSGAALKLHESNEALQSVFFTATRIKRHQVRFFNFLSMLLA